MTGDPGLFGDEEGAPSSFAQAVAEAGEKRGIGRPPGARNRKSVDFERLYHSLGFKDPLLLLGELVTFDPRALQGVIGGKLADVVDLQRRAAVDLAPYLHGKKPNEVIVHDERLPTLIVVTNANQLEEAQQSWEQRRQVALSAGVTIEGEKAGIAGVSEGEE